MRSRHPGLSFQRSAATGDGLPWNRAGVRKSVLKTPVCMGPDRDSMIPVGVVSGQKLTSALAPAISAGAAERSDGTTYCTSGVMRTAGVSA